MSQPLAPPSCPDSLPDTHCFLAGLLGQLLPQQGQPNVTESCISLGRKVTGILPPGVSGSSLSGRISITEFRSSPQSSRPRPTKNHALRGEITETPTAWGVLASSGCVRVEAGRHNCFSRRKQDPKQAGKWFPATR